MFTNVYETTFSTREKCKCWIEAMMSLETSDNNKSIQQIKTQLQSKLQCCTGETMQQVTSSKSDK